MKTKSFFGTFRALLPKCRLFDLTHPTNMRKFFEALGLLGDDVKREISDVYLDYFPETTWDLAKWEKTFKINFSTNLFSESDRRTALKILWRLRYGNVTAEFLQETLRLITPGMYVSDNSPQTDVTALVQNYKSVNGNRYMVCGHKRAICSAGAFAIMYKSVNGKGYMCCGNKRAVNGYMTTNGGFIPTMIRNGSTGSWNFSEDSDMQSTYFFVAGEVRRDSNHKITTLQRLDVEKKWQKFLEYIILASKPVHTTAITWIRYTENESSETIYIIPSGSRTPDVVYDEPTETLYIYNIEMELIDQSNQTQEAQ